ncbi:hypothetical protein TKK_0015341 [Trichogramma kaykai]
MSKKNSAGDTSPGLHRRIGNCHAVLSDEDSIGASAPARGQLRRILSTPATTTCGFYKFVVFSTPATATCGFYEFVVFSTPATATCGFYEFVVFSTPATATCGFYEFVVFGALRLRACGGHLAAARDIEGRRRANSGATAILRTAHSFVSLPHAAAARQTTALRQRAFTLRFVWCCASVNIALDNFGI